MRTLIGDLRRTISEIQRLFPARYQDSATQKDCIDAINAAIKKLEKKPPSITVGELIKQLAQYDQDRTVLLSVEEGLDQDIAEIALSSDGEAVLITGYDPEAEIDL